MEDGIWGGIADGGRCTESGVDDSEWSGLEKRRRGMSFQFVCSDTFPHSSSSLPITASLPLSTNHQCMGLIFFLLPVCSERNVFLFIQFIFALKVVEHGRSAH